jgi:hypothetical protein
MGFAPRHILVKTGSGNPRSNEEEAELRLGLFFMSAWTLAGILPGLEDLT